MASRARWRDKINLETINTIDTHTGMDELAASSTAQTFPTILDGQDIPCCTVTSDGKSAAFFNSWNTSGQIPSWTSHSETIYRCRNPTNEGTGQ